MAKSTITVTEWQHGPDCPIKRGYRPSIHDLDEMRESGVCPFCGVQATQTEEPADQVIARAARLIGIKEKG